MEGRQNTGITIAPTIIPYSRLGGGTTNLKQGLYVDPMCFECGWHRYDHETKLQSTSGTYKQKRVNKTSSTRKRKTTWAKIEVSG